MVKGLTRISSLDKIQPSQTNSGLRTTTRKQIVEARKRNNAYKSNKINEGLPASNKEVLASMN